MWLSSATEQLALPYGGHYQSPLITSSNVFLPQTPPIPTFWSRLFAYKQILIVAVTLANPGEEGSARW